MNGRNIILLYMVNRIDGERSIAGCYHILTGKKSAQPIQDAALYGYSSWFGIFPEWTRASFEQEMAQLDEAATSISGTLDSYDFERRAFLAEGSLWTGIEAIAFSKKLNLLSQVISHYLTKQQNYSPMIQDIESQLAVKQFWQGLRDKRSFVVQFAKDMYSFLEQLEDDFLASIVVERFSGYQIHGRTFQQLGYRFQIPEAILHLYYYQVIASLMEYSVRHNLAIKALMEQGMSGASSLTLSAQKTYTLLQQGYQLAEISKLRQLKQNTLEDHLIEIAIHLTDFDFSSYVSTQIIERVVTVSNLLNTRKLRQLKEHLPVEISYFQIRLALVLYQRDKYIGRKV